MCSRAVVRDCQTVQNDRLVNSHPKDRLEYLMKLSLQSINHVPSDAQMSRPASQAGTPGDGTHAPSELVCW